MKALVHRIYADPRYAKVFHWGRLITITGSVQVLVQAIGVVCGILVIRLLPVHQYALYTLANTMLGTMVILADGGISTGVMSQGAKVWQNKKQLGIVLSTGIDLRKKFTVGSLVLAVPVLFYLLTYHGSGWLLSALVVLALIPAFFTSVSSNLLQIVPKLRQNILPIQKIQVTANLTRLALSGLALVLFPWSFVAILAAGLPQIWANKRLHKVSAEYASIDEYPDILVRKEILTIVKRTLPVALYYCLSEQLIIWLITIFGTTSSIAQVGAFDRVATGLILFTVLFNTLITPRFARLRANKMLLLNRYLQIQGGLLILGFFVIGMVYLFSDEVLWILGTAYANLKTEFILSITGSYIILMAGMLYTLISSRGWVINPLVTIPLNLLAIIGGILLMDVSTVRGVFTFNILVMGTMVIIYFSYGLMKIIKVNKAQLVSHN